MLGKLLSRKKFFIVGLKQLASLLESNISCNQSEIAIFSPFSGLKSLLLATHYVGLVGADEVCPFSFGRISCAPTQSAILMAQT